MATNISKEDFEYICRLVHNHSSLVLESGKEYLVESRLTPLYQKNGFSSMAEFIRQLRSRPHGILHTQTIERMMTHETYFFRDNAPFNALKKTVLPELIEKKNIDRKLNIWCGACSSGQEPYSIAMIIREYFPVLSDWTIKIIASDYSSEILLHARRGRYSQFEVNRGMPANFLMKYFQRKDMYWEIAENIRRMIDFREINLIEPWPSLPVADIIFLRNVLIYFNVATKKQILAQVKRLLKQDSYLFLGNAETTINLDDSYELLQIGKAVCYRLRQYQEGKYAIS